ncbi:MAG: hypothetical protein JJV98_07280 [Desulfosarcina sp.]|nr:hypothetical protein [Desulfobacterales bacterium]
MTIMTDLYGQNAEIGKSQRLTQSLHMAPEKGLREVILMAPVSVHNGTAYGDITNRKLF